MCWLRLRDHVQIVTCLSPLRKGPVLGTFGMVASTEEGFRVTC